MLPTINIFANTPEGKTHVTERLLYENRQAKLITGYYEKNSILQDKTPTKSIMKKFKF